MESGAEMSKFSKQKIQMAISPHFAVVILSFHFYKRFGGGGEGKGYSGQFQFFPSVGQADSYIFPTKIYDSLLNFNSPLKQHSTDHCILC